MKTRHPKVEVFNFFVLSKEIKRNYKLFKIPPMYMFWLAVLLDDYARHLCHRISVIGWSLPLIRNRWIKS